MSAFIRDDRRYRHAGSWMTSLALHGLLGGMIVWFAVLTKSPVITLEEPFHWDVALMSAPVSPSMPVTTPALAAQSSAPPPVQTPRVTPPPAPAEPVTSVPAPDSEVAPVLASPTNTAASNQVAPPQPKSPMVSTPSVKEQGVSGSEEMVATSPSPASSPVVPSMASAPLTPAPSAVNTGELADQLWRRMESLKRYPYLARRNGWEGKVFIKVVLGGDGRLLHAEILESSGHEVLDQDALRVLRAAAALKVDPNSSVAQGCASAASAGCVGAAWQQQATFTLPVAYRFQR